MFKSTSVPLSAVHDLAMLDLDGVVYIGRDAVPGAARGIAAARQAGMSIAFVTNNASRPPEAVAAHLVELGVTAAPEDVVTSAQAAARLLVDRFGVGARVVCLGGDGLDRALTGAGLVAVGTGDDDAVAIVSGYGPDVRWHAITTAAVRIAGGLPWVATNTDSTFPTDAGRAPGHGVLVDMLSRFTGVWPTVAGKPERPLLEETILRVGGRRPLMVGDRLDTDIAAAHRMDVDSMLVLTGVTDLAQLAAASPAERPTYLAEGLDGLCATHPSVAAVEDGWSCGAARVSVRSGILGVDRFGGGAAALTDTWRAATAAAWDHLDQTGVPADVSRVSLPRQRSDAR